MARSEAAHKSLACPVPTLWEKVQRGEVLESRLGVRTFHILRDVIGRAYDIRMAHEEKRLTLDEAHTELARLAIPV